MNLYVPNPQADSPFGFGDLEWLYRQQDVDGASLTSRLAQLAPVSFTNPIDGQRRRRLFSLDGWEMNNFVWANDNPRGCVSRRGIPDQQPLHTDCQRRLYFAERPGVDQLQHLRATQPDRPPYYPFSPTTPSPRRRPPHRWPIATRRSTSTTRCRSPMIPTSRSARSGSATPIN